MIKLYGDMDEQTIGEPYLCLPEYTYHQHIGWMYGNCCGDGVFSGAAKAWKGSEAFSWLYACVSCLSVWSQDRMEFYVKVVGSLPLFPSSLLSFIFSLFIFSFLFFIFLYLSPFFLFFDLSFFQASQGWHLLETRILLWMAGTWSVTLCDFPHTWTLCESQVCNVGVSFWVYFHSKEHQSVQLMQSLCSQASYVP